MPISAPNPVSLIDPQHGSGGTLNEAANTLGHASEATPNVLAAASSAFASAQSQIDAIMQILRAGVPLPNLIIVTDAQGNPTVMLGDMVSLDNQAISGIWTNALLLGGQGPFDAGNSRGLAEGGVIHLSSASGTDFINLDVSPANQIDLNKSINVGVSYKVANVQVVQAQQTGWGTVAGTLLRSSFNTGTVTTAQVAQLLGALITDLRAHGLIGT